MDIADIKFCEENFMLVDEQFHEQKREIEKEIARRRAENRSRTKGLTSVMTRLQCATGTAAVISKLNLPCPSASTKPEPIENINISTKKRDSINQTQKSKNDTNVENNRSQKMTSSIQAIGDSRTHRDCVPEQPTEDSTPHIGGEPVISESETGRQCPTELLEKVDDVPAVVVSPDCPPQVNKGSDIPNDIESRKSTSAQTTPAHAIPDSQQADVASTSIITGSGPQFDPTKTDGEPKKWTFRASGCTRTLMVRLSLFLLLGLVSVFALLWLAPSPSPQVNSPVTELQATLASATARTGGWLRNIFSVESEETALRKAEYAKDVLQSVVNAVAPAFQ